jgi:hypothetical protein
MNNMSTIGIVISVTMITLTVVCIAILFVGVARTPRTVRSKTYNASVDGLLNEACLNHGHRIPQKELLENFDYVQNALN